MSKQEKSKTEAVVKKLKTERNKYFVPEIGYVEADSVEDVPAELEKLKEKQEDTDGDN